MNVTRWSLAPAIANALQADKVDPDTGQSRQRRIWHKTASVIFGIGYAINPAVTIAAVPGASGRLTHRRGAVANMAGWIVVAVACVAGILIPDPSLLSIIPITVVLLAITAFGSLWTALRSVRWLPGPFTHILSDMVRHQYAAAGSGRDLIEQLTADQNRIIVGIAHSQALWDKVYEQHSEAIGSSSVGKSGFRLIKK